MGRNLIICCDGTGNEFGTNNTNIVRIVQASKRDFDTQRIYYDPGVGTLPEPGWSGWIRKHVSDLAGLAFGAGLKWKVQQAYTYLMDWWEPGDTVYLFGFSRGAYAVRVLAGLLHELGLMAHGSDNMIPYAMRLYATARHDRENNLTRDQSPYWKLRDEFRETFARPVPDSDDKRFPVHFMGLFDTVSSVGWAWDPPKYPFTIHNPSVKVVRHAVSIDERRWFFRQYLLGDQPGQDREQQWFPGVHSDVGGGYPELEGGLWRPSFEWMLGEAAAHGLILDPAALGAVRNHSAPPTKPSVERQHESLTWYWWPAEFFPKWFWTPGEPKPVLQLGLGRHRPVRDGARIQKAALDRIRETAYTPPNLSAKFRTYVRSLPQTPAWVEYSESAPEAAAMAPSPPHVVGDSSI